MYKTLDDDVLCSLTVYIVNCVQNYFLYITLKLTDCKICGLKSNCMYEFESYA